MASGEGLAVPMWTARSAAAAASNPKIAHSSTPPKGRGIKTSSAPMAQKITVDMSAKKRQ